MWKKKNQTIYVFLINPTICYVPQTDTYSLGLGWPREGVGTGAITNSYFDLLNRNRLD